jgi:hypothetical protein
MTAAMRVAYRRLEVNSAIALSAILAARRSHHTRCACDAENAARDL